jgi:hypothetical protein
MHQSLTELIRGMKKDREGRAKFEKKIEERLENVSKEIGEVKEGINNLDSRWFLYFDTLDLKKPCSGEEKKI